MNLLALLMFISLIMIVITSFDPRFVTVKEVKSTLIRFSMGVVLGFFIMLLYGLGFPGLRYLFMLIGIGGFAHLFITRKEHVEPTPQQTVSLSS